MIEIVDHSVIVLIKKRNFLNFSKGDNGMKKNLTEKKKIKLYSEPLYFFAIILIAFAVAMVSAANFGVSMIVAPAYILSLKFSFLTFGQAEYVLQSIMFVVFCILMKKVKAVYFSSFLCCIIYGAVLDLWRMIIPAFNPEITPPGSMGMPVRIFFFVCGMLLTAFAVALFFNTYLYPQVYDFFVKGISGRFNIKLSKFKTCYDFGSLTVAVIMTLIFFGKFNGVGVGTIIMTALNGTIIGFFSKFIENHFDIVPVFGKLEKKFEI